MAVVPGTTAKLLLLGMLSIGITAFANSAGAASAAQQQETIAGVPVEEALRLGERMYREGILPSGEPLKAIVKDDIPIESSQFTCANCHQRSGFGSMEGTIRTWPIHGAQLYAPLSKFKRIPMRGRAAGPGAEEVLRPAYTDETLARVLETGLDPSGRLLNTIMPVYSLNDRDMAIMVFYLKNLSTRTEPGVTDTTLRFATIVTDEVPKAARDAMLVPLQSFINNWRISRGMERSTRAEAYLQEGAASSLRQLSLVVWELKGPAQSWRGQLEEYYRKEPVFAILGGITTNEWEPIHRFCEGNRIPSIFPLTDFPVLEAAGGYTLYLSRGLAQEGEAAARYLHSRSDLPKDLVVVQIFRTDRPGLALSKAFQRTWADLGHAVPENSALAPGEPLPAAFWKGLKARHSRAVFVLWLNETDFPDLKNLAGAGGMPAMVLASSSLLGKRMYSLPEQHRSSLYLTYPYSLPQERRSAAAGMPAAADPDLSLETRMLPLFTLLRGPLAGIRSYVHRDLFIELLEATPDLTAAQVPFPRLSFGTGQRYASKGCYVVRIAPGPSPELLKQTGWVIP